MNNAVITKLILSFLSISIQVSCTQLNEKEENCVNELRLNRSIIEAWNVEPLLPEDNKEIKQYAACYWKKLGYLQENGDLDYIKIGEVVHTDLKQRIRSDCLHITANVVSNCKENVLNNTDEGLKVIRMWNCLTAETENIF